MTQRTKIILALGIILFIYGYVCRMLNIYFFWDSKTLGFLILLMALLSYWVDLRKRRKQQGKKLTWVTIGICFVGFGLLIVPVVIVIIKSSDAYQTATAFIESNKTIKAEVGNVKSFGLLTTGSVQSSSINGVQTGSAVLEIIVIGENKNKDITVSLEQSPGEDWKVTDAR